jgi:hypothetical protein
MISLWRYTEYPRKFCGWHLTADNAGVASLVSLIDLLRTSDEPDFRTVSITPPSPRILRAPNFQGGDAQTTSPLKWRISHSAKSETWDFPPGLDPASLSIGDAYIPKLIAGLEGIPRGMGDYAIGGRDLPARLCFWWLL